MRHLLCNPLTWIFFILFCTSLLRSEKYIIEQSESSNNSTSKYRIKIYKKDTNNPYSDHRLIYFDEEIINNQKKENIFEENKPYKIESNTYKDAIEEFLNENLTDKNLHIYKLQGENNSALIAYYISIMTKKEINADDLKLDNLNFKIFQDNEERNKCDNKRNTSENFSQMIDFQQPIKLKDYEVVMIKNKDNQRKYNHYWYFKVKKNDKSISLPIVFQNINPKSIKQVKFSYLSRKNTWSQKLAKSGEITFNKNLIPESSADDLVILSYKYLFEKKENENEFIYKFNDKKFSPGFSILRTEYFAKGYFLAKEINEMSNGKGLLIFIYNQDELTDDQLIDLLIKEYKIDDEAKFKSKGIKIVKDREKNIFSFQKTEVKLNFTDWGNIKDEIINEIKNDIKSFISQKNTDVSFEDDDTIILGNMQEDLVIELDGIEKFTIKHNSSGSIQVKPSFKNIEISIRIPDKIVNVLTNNYIKNSLTTIKIENGCVEGLKINDQGNLASVNIKILKKEGLDLVIHQGRFWNEYTIENQELENKRVELGMKWKHLSKLNFEWENSNRPEITDIKKRFNKDILELEDLVKIDESNSYIVFSKDELKYYNLNNEKLKELSEILEINDTLSINKPNKVKIIYKKCRLDLSFKSEYFPEADYYFDKSIKENSINDSPIGISYKNSKKDIKIDIKYCHKDKYWYFYYVDGYEYGVSFNKYFIFSEDPNKKTYTVKPDNDNETIELSVDYFLDKLDLVFDCMLNGKNELKDQSIDIYLEQENFKSEITITGDDLKKTVDVPLHTLKPQNTFNLNIMVKDQDFYTIEPKLLIMGENKENYKIKISRKEITNDLRIISSLDLEPIKLEFSIASNSPERIDFLGKSIISNKMEIKYPKRFLGQPKIEIAKKIGYSIEGSLYDKKKIVKDVNLDSLEINLNIEELPVINYIYIDKSQPRYSTNPWYGGEVIYNCIKEKFINNSEIMAKGYFTDNQILYEYKIDTQKDLASFFNFYLSQGVANPTYEFNLVGDFIKEKENDPHSQTHLYEVSIFLSNETVKLLNYDDLILEQLNEFVTKHQIKIYVRKDNKLKDCDRFNIIKGNVEYF